MSLRSDVVALLEALVATTALTDAYGDFAPDGAVLPYVSLLIDISEVPTLSGDGRTRATERLFQVDLWESRHGEDETLREAVWAALDNATVGSSMTRLRVRSVDRVPDPDLDIAHRAFTVAAISRVPA